jgi:uridine kinase
MEKIINEINDLALSKKIFIVAIDGMPGGGKSTLLKHFQKNMNNIQIIRMDDFYNPLQERDDWEKLKKEALEPLRKNKIAKYKIYDWQKSKIVDSIPILPNGIIFVEGICSMKRDLINFYDYKVWVDCPPEVGLKRALKRDKNYKKDLWINKWIPETIDYIKKEKPYLKADVIVNYKDIPLS